MIIRMTDYTEGSWGSGPAYLAKGLWQGENGSYRQSTYRHPLGVVEIYEQNRREMTNLRFRHEGRDYWRHWDKLWGDKTVARLAREFIEDIA
jgi:hypothetical protein